MPTNTALSMDGIMSDPNKRRSKRVSCKLPIIFTAGPNSFWETESINVCEGGFLVRLPANFDIAKPSKLRMRLRDIISDADRKDESNEYSFVVRIAHQFEDALGIEIISII